MAKQNPKKTLRRFYQDIREAEPIYDSLHKNIPLKISAHLEKHFRALFLDNEEIAKEADEFFTNYTKRNPHILTPDAKKAIEHIGFSNNNRIYIVELDIPQLEGMHKHVTGIDLVSFNPINKTMQVLEETVIKPIQLNSFSHPHQKGNIKNRYWSSHSFTHENSPHKEEITDIKLRKRIHGNGYSLTNNELTYLRQKHSNVVNAFAE